MISYMCTHISVPLVQQELLTLPAHMSSPRFLVGLMLLDLLFSGQCFVDCCQSFFVAIVLYVLRFTNSDQLFGIFNFSSKTWFRNDEDGLLASYGAVESTTLGTLLFNVNVKLTSCMHFDRFWVKIKNKKHIVGIVQKLNGKIIERDKIDTSNTQIYDRSLSWLGTGTSI